jgi:DNA repair exonuclease SbcCD nuclease subunit
MTDRTPIAVMTADWHLKPYTWASRPEICGDAYRSATFIQRYCVDKRLPLFVLGDILDVRNPSADTVGFLVDLIDNVHFENQEFYFIQGQHELNRERPWASCNCNAYWLNKRQLDIHPRLPSEDRIRFYGLDYQSADKLTGELLNIAAETDVLLAHQVWHERMGGKFTVAQGNAEGAFSDVPMVKMVISGDFHSHRFSQHIGKDGQTIVAVSPGSIYMKTLEEDPAKYFFVLYDDLSLESVRIHTRPVLRDSVYTDVELTRVIDRFAAEHAEVDAAYPDKPIWHVECRATVADAMRRLQAAAKGRAHLFVRPMKESVEVDVDTEETKEVAPVTESLNSVEDFIPQCCPADSPVFHTAVRLYRAASVKDEVKSIIDEAIKAFDQPIL